MPSTRHCSPNCHDSDKAFKPIGVIALFPNVLLVNPGGTGGVGQELVAQAKLKKNAVLRIVWKRLGTAFGWRDVRECGRCRYAACALGGAPALNDVIGGQVPVFGNLASTLQHVRAGKLKPLAVTSARRSPILPTVPTMAEAGVAGYEVYRMERAVCASRHARRHCQQAGLSTAKTLDAPM